MPSCNPVIEYSLFYESVLGYLTYPSSRCSQNKHSLCLLIDVDTNIAITDLTFKIEAKGMRKNAITAQIKVNVQPDKSKTPIMSLNK